MAKEEFDIQFQNITKEMVEIAFEYVDFNKDEIDKIFIIGSIEEGGFTYNMFFEINNAVVKKENVNKFSKKQYDISSEKSFALLELGNQALVRLSEAFKDDNREIPTLIKIIYQPKTGSFACKLSYDLQFSYNESRAFYDVFNEWFEQEKSGNYEKK